MKNPGSGREIDASVSIEERVGWVWAGMGHIFLFCRPGTLHVFPFDMNFSLPNVEETVRTGILDPGDIRNASLHRFGPSRLPSPAQPQSGRSCHVDQCVCLIPGILKMFSRFNDNSSESTRKILPYLLTVDGFAIVAQLSGLFLWTALN